MPNRILKDSICQSEKIDTLSEAAECLYYRLLVQCDDYGTYKADPRIIKSVCFPLKDNMTAAKTDKLLDELIDSGLIMPYKVDGKEYIYFLNWTKHQQIKNKRSKYPMPSDSDLEQYHSNLERCRSKKVRYRSLIQSNPIQSESNPNPNPTPNEDGDGQDQPIESWTPDFNSFWLLYPRKIAKAEAEKAFNKIHPDASLFQLMSVSLEKWKKSNEWTKDGGQFVPHASTWLNGRRWEDEAPTPGERSKPKPSNIGNFDQRQYNDAALNGMYEEVRPE